MAHPFQSPYAAEFRAFLDPQLAGKTPDERRSIVISYVERARAEGWVPVKGGLVAVAPSARQRSWATLPAQEAGTVVGTGRFRLSPWKLAALIPLCLLIILMLLPGSGEERPLIQTLPVTAQDGPTAPVSLMLGSRTLTVRTFDPSKGWPDARLTEDAALWGRTTINVVLAVAGDDLADELDQLQPGATLRLQQARGKVVTYRVTEHLVADMALIDHANQRRVGLTLIGVLRGRDRRVVHALPADVPVPIAMVGDVRIEAGQPRWVTAVDAAPTLALSITLTAGAEPLAGPVTVEAAGHVVPSDVVPDASGRSTMLTVQIPAPAAAQLDLVVGLPGGQRGVVSIAVPPVPTATVAWGSAQHEPTGLAVAFTITPDGPMVLQPGDLQCQSVLGREPLRVEGLTLPMVLTTAQVVRGRCPSTVVQRGQLVEIHVFEAVAALTIP
jgi:hypothetical protein